MNIQPATNATAWDEFLKTQPWSSFLQSWTMGEVYRDIGQEPIRLEGREGERITAICQAILVPARRGRHLMVQYGPVLSEIRNLLRRGSGQAPSEIRNLLEELKKIAKEKGCSFIRLSPFWPKEDAPVIPGAVSAPLHLLAEHIWFLNLQGKTEDDILKGMRPTTRNLIRRAEKEGVTVHKSPDIDPFLHLHKQTYQRHKFTPYTDAFFRAQFQRFASTHCTLYVATYQNEPVAASVHMHFGGETSYHHGASSLKYPKIPASTLLQWRAIQDAMKRGDHIYNFWGIAPLEQNPKPPSTKLRTGSIRNPKHPFAGVTLFKTGFGGELLELVPCMDIPISKRYYCTRIFETLRRWKRGF